jgi:hypothetical protein
MPEGLDIDDLIERTRKRAEEMRALAEETTKLLEQSKALKVISEMETKEKETAEKHLNS